ncbi:MAG: carboxypeptidase-like regulatory domain-containing protein [Dysgonamonadaceae bacterium]|jgi:hypothetical protein|nr:carboxypeptidase-like regulatory domain-containing protein [Dysgonamonadaceae bacterium]
MKYFIIPLFLLFPLFSHSQYTVQGTVRDAETGKNVESAIVSLLQGTNYADYGMTKKDGTFILSAPQWNDSLKLIITRIGYKSQTVKLYGNSANYNIAIEKSEIQLREVTVRAAPIRNRSDTVLYNVGSFSSDADRYIGDVLKKMPGIEVSDNGGISYQGKAVTHFYVEGLDLLGGRYGVITGNLPHEEVTSVQIIESNQPLKMLKNVIFPDEPAINLKLRNSNMSRPVGTLKAGVGNGNGLLGLLDASGLQYAKNRQAASTLKANNAGVYLADELTTHYGTSGGFATEREPAAIITQNGLISGSERNSVMNHSYASSLNLLQKIDDDKQARVNFAYSKNKTETMTLKHSRFITADSLLAIDEQEATCIGNNNIDAALTFTDNAAAHFMENQMKINTQWHTAEADILNPMTVDEMKKFTGINMSNFLKITRKANKRYINFSSYFRYSSQPQSMIASLAGDESNNETEIKQTIGRSNFYSKNGSFIMVAVSSSRIKLNFDLETELDGIETELANPTFTDSIHNNLKNSDIRLIISPEYGFQNPHVRINFTMPVVYQHISINDRQYREHDKFNPLRFNPSASLRYILNGYLEANSRFKINHNTGDFTDLLQSLIQTGYRNLIQKSGVWVQSQTRSTYVAVNYKNPIRGLFFSINANLMTMKFGRMANENFSGITSIAGSTAKSNITVSRIVSANISKFISAIETTVSFSANYSTSTAIYGRQDKIMPVNAETLGASARINSCITKNIIFFFESYISHSHQTANQYSGKTSNRQTYEKHHANLQIFPIKKTVLKINIERSGTTSQNPSTNHCQTFLDASVAYRPGNMEFALDVTNIFNLAQDVQTSFAGANSFSTVRVLRGREIMATVRLTY